MKKGYFLIFVLFLFISGCTKEKATTKNYVSQTITACSFFSNETFSITCEAEDMADGDNTANYFYAKKDISELIEEYKTSEYFYSKGNDYISFLKNGNYFCLEKGNDEGVIVLSSENAIFNVSLDEEMYNIPFPEYISEILTTNTKLDISNKEKLIAYYQNYQGTLTVDVSSDSILIKNVKNYKPNTNQTRNILISFGEDITFSVQAND